MVPIVLLSKKLAIIIDFGIVEIRALRQRTDCKACFPCSRSGFTERALPG